MNADVRRVDAVILTPDDARFLAEALRHFAALAAERGSRPTARVQKLQAQLAAASTDAEPDVDARTQVPQQDWLSLSAHDLLDTTAAARILGCTPSNVRDLVRRGSLPAHLTGRRWLLEADAVLLRARRSAA